MTFDAVRYDLQEYFARAQLLSSDSRMAMEQADGLIEFLRDHGWMVGRVAGLGMDITAESTTNFPGPYYVLCDSSDNCPVAYAYWSKDPPVPHYHFIGSPDHPKESK